MKLGDPSENGDPSEKGRMTKSLNDTGHRLVSPFVPQKKLGRLVGVRGLVSHLLGEG